jgi:hypothetical protein
MTRITYVVALLLAGCGSDFEFVVEVSPIPDGYAVTVNGEPQPIELGKLGPSVRVSFTFSEYTSGGPPIDFSFTKSGSTTYTGQSAPGVCRASCINPSCPAPDSIEKEEIQITPLANFGVGSFTCLICQSDDDLVKVCI